MKNQAKRILLLLLFLISIINLCANGQNRNYDCKIIECLLKEDVIQKYYHIRSFEGDFILVVDTSKYFDNCSIALTNDSKVILVHEKRAIPGKQVWVEIYSIEKKGNKYKIFLGQENSGKFGYVIFKKVKGNYIMKKYQLGQT